jgi:hypothetical protein
MFIRNLDAFTQAFGVQQAPMIFALSQIDWPSDDNRNDFIYKLTGVSIKAKGSYVQN